MRSRLLRLDAYGRREESVLPAAGRPEQRGHLRHVSPAVAHRGSGHATVKGEGGPFFFSWQFISSSYFGKICVSEVIWSIKI